MPEQRHIQPRLEVQATPVDQHGALDYEELARRGISPDEVFDFSANINPFGPSPAVGRALQKAAIERYPDRESLALRTVLAERSGLDRAQILVGNGTAELLWLIAMAFVRPGDRVLILNPTFGEYARSVALMGARVVSLRAGEEGCFTLAPETIHASLRSHSPRLAFICNPNNPTGTAFTREIINDFASNHPETLFVIDEAYLQFTPDLLSCMDLDVQNMLVLRSMTKDYALAGLRLGFTTGPQDLIEALAKVRPPWNVNAVAQEAGLAALMDEHYLRQCMVRLRAARDELLSGLIDLGLQPVPSTTHYFIIEVGNAAEFRRRLLEYRVQVRDCASFDLASYIRVSTRKADENVKLLSALEEVLPCCT